MAGIPDASVLIQDLLSPASTALPSTTPALISYHLSTIPLEPANSASLISSILSYLTASPALWRGQANRHSPTSPWQEVDFDRAREVYNALVQGFLYRAGELTRDLGTGWRARRRFAAYLELYLAGVNAEPEGSCHPTVRVLTASAALQALQTIKLKKDKLYVGGSSLMGRSEDMVVVAWEEYFREADRDQHGFASTAAAATEWTGSASGVYEIRNKNHSAELPAWLAAQTLPMLSIDRLSQGPLSNLLLLLSSSFSRAFAAGHVFAELPASLESTPDGLAWTVPSASHTLLTSLIASPIFSALGPLSRAIGRLIEGSGERAKIAPNDPAPLAAVQSMHSMLERLVSRVQRGWAETAWSEIEDESGLAPFTRDKKEPWTLLKSLLFSITLIHSSLLVVVTPRPGLLPTKLQLELAEQAIKILGRSYFITLKFGTEGFSAWKGAWLGLLEVAKQDSDRGAEKLMEALEPSRIGQLHERAVERSTATYYLNMAEHLMKKLGSEYTELRVLRCCRPYLDRTRYRETFESAHSVMLAVFATQKACATDLAPWYIELLLRSYPTLMSASQLRLAFTTVVRCASNSDDALAWYCIMQLVDAIRALPPTASSSEAPTATSSALARASGHTAAVVQVSEAVTSDAVIPPATGREYDAEATQTRLDEASNLSPLEIRALSLKRGHLLLTLIDQTTAVNLILLRKLLDEIWTFVKEEGEGDQAAREQEESPKEALVKVLFGTLGEGLDATKREEGVRYWLERSEELAEPRQARL